MDYMVALFLVFLSNLHTVLHRDCINLPPTKNREGGFLFFSFIFKCRQRFLPIAVSGSLGLNSNFDQLFPCETICKLFIQTVAWFPLYINNYINSTCIVYCCKCKVPIYASAWHTMSYVSIIIILLSSCSS